MDNGWILYFEMRWILGGYCEHLEVDIESGQCGGKWVDNAVEDGWILPISRDACFFLAIKTRIMGGYNPHPAHNARIWYFFF